MKGFKRNDTLFSLCGLNCGLCVMQLDGYCPGCGGGEGNQPCAIARCILQRGGLDYCFLCNEYPCEKYEGIEKYDSFITHRHQLQDAEKVKQTGMDSYRSELKEKMRILRILLAEYNDGRRKSFFCLAVNLLNLADIQKVMMQLESESDALSAKEKAVLAAELFQKVAVERSIVLKLNKKTK